jgi:hypothetical protein
MVATKTVVHVADLAAEQAYVEQRDPATVVSVELAGVRTYLAVPMLKEQSLIRPSLRICAFTSSRARRNNNSLSDQRELAALSTDCASPNWPNPIQPEMEDL